MLGLVPSAEVTPYDHCKSSDLPVNQDSPPPLYLQIKIIHFFKTPDCGRVLQPNSLGGQVVPNTQWVGWSRCLWALLTKLFTFLSSCCFPWFSSRPWFNPAGLLGLDFCFCSLLFPPEKGLTNRIARISHSHWSNLLKNWRALSSRNAICNYLYSQL